ncbi:MAG: hypothetical protein ACYDA2_03060 [Acidimicrobiales bacterium]
MSSITTTDTHDPAVPTDREALVLGMKIAVGFVMGAIMTGVVGPIALAIVIGLATGH